MLPGIEGSRVVFGGYNVALGGIPETLAMRDPRSPVCSSSSVSGSWTAVGDGIKTSRLLPARLVVWRWIVKMGQLRFTDHGFGAPGI